MATTFDIDPVNRIEGHQKWDITISGGTGNEGWVQTARIQGQNQHAQQCIAGLNAVKQAGNQTWMLARQRTEVVGDCAVVFARDLKGTPCQPQTHVLADFS